MSESEHNKILYSAWEADPSNHLPDEKRKEAVKIFLGLLRAQVIEYRQHKRDSVSRLLQQAVTEFALRIFADPDPVSAMDDFVQGKRKRGKRAVNAERDFRIAVRVAHKMNEGMSLDDACALVAEEEQEIRLSPERIENIYKAHHTEAKAEVALQMLQANAVGEPGRPTGDGGST
jgi:uncharacterized protein YoaH (UPF0181 family)